MTAALIPLFTIIVLGALAARSGYVPAATIAPLSTFVVRVALPALIFTAVLVVIVLSGSLWVMYHLNANMMPMSPHEARVQP